MWTRYGLIAMAVAGLSVAAQGKAVVFWSPGFPAVETETPTRSVLEEALHSQAPVFLGLDELRKAGALEAGDLLVLPYGSAFPADAWETIRQHLEHGNLLTIGGRPLSVPVRQAGSGWQTQPAQATYSRFLGFEHTLVASESASHFAWSAEEPAFPALDWKARQVFILVSDSGGGRRRGLGFLTDAKGNRLSAPVTADDLERSRRVYLNFEPTPGFWATAAGKTLLTETAQYAGRGAIRMWVDVASLTLEAGDHAAGVVYVDRALPTAASMRLELMTGSRVLSTIDVPCSGSLQEPFRFESALSDPGLYAIRATLRSNAVELERYTTGLWVRDQKLLRSGPTLTVGRDYFRLAGKPYLPAGVNYFSTDPYGASFFVGGSIGGNPWLWERDFSELEKQGVTFVRTGVWLNRTRYVETVTGAASGRMLSALEAFLHSAARHHMQVSFTLFAFDPQTMEQVGPGQDANRLGEGTNPYTDPAAITAEKAWVQSIARRFRDVPFLSFDLINEPSFSNPKKPWKGNQPNPDPTELAAWREWLSRHYPSPQQLAEAWRIPAVDLPAFASATLPDPLDLEAAREGNPRLARAIDFNLFAQDAFQNWASQMVRAMREAGSQQIATVGQDEGGVINRVLNQFYGGTSDLAYTVLHTWWQDDALLWDSVAAKRTDKPNLIGETGPQPVWSANGDWRFDEAVTLPLVERKMALGFAAGNAGAVFWDWSRGDTFGLLRRDDSYKPWMQVVNGIAAFAKAAEPYATETRRPEIAIVLPQSEQLSVANAYALEAQQASVRALYHYARQAAYAVGEYQLDLLGDPKLIIVPSPWVLRQDAWDTLMKKVRGGATMLISGRIDADEHFWSVPSRTDGWAPGYQPGFLSLREHFVTWPGGSARLSYGGEKTRYVERGVLPNDALVMDAAVGKGRIIYVTLPVELADQLDSVGRIYRYAIEKAGVARIYETSVEDPGILICPTQLTDATLYVITSESSMKDQWSFQDLASGAKVSVRLDPGRAAMALLGHDGKMLASYHLN